MTRPDVFAFHQQIVERTGLAPELLDRPALEGFVRQRCVELDLSHADAYRELVLRNSDELNRLVQEVSVPETWFFRYPASFELLRDHAACLWRKQHASLRLLSVACATGEEPYSMAIAATQAGWPTDRLLIDAVDRHERSLSIARTANYGNRSFRDPLPPWAEKWFRQGPAATQVDGRLAATVRFHCQDVLTAVPPSDGTKYDAVFCRNLFIYLHGAARTKLVDFLASVLAPEGLLFVGHAEYAVLPQERFQAAGVRHAFALRQRAWPDRSDSARCVQQAAASPKKRPILPIDRGAGHPTPALRSEAVPHCQPTLDDARALADSGQLEAAIDAIQSLSSSSPDVFDLLGSIQLSLGRFEQARDSLRKVLYIDPHHETALLQMAIVCERLDETEEAARYRRRAARAHVDQTPPKPKQKHD